MDILIISHFLIFPWEKGNDRFLYLAEHIDNTHNVEIVGSVFAHAEKRNHKNYKEHVDQLKYTLTLIDEPAYPKNVCLKRIRSHAVFAKNLNSYLKKRRKPDIVYCAVPSLDAAYVAATYCKRNNIPFIIDIQDLWPEAFQMVFDMPIISNIAFAPMKRKANRIYSAADEIIAVSRTYADRALCVNTKCKDAHVVYLGTDADRFDACAAVTDIDKMNDGTFINEIVCDDKIRLAYAGTLGSSYDLTVVFDALKKSDEQTLGKVEFIVMGDGPRRKEFEASSCGLPVKFCGALSYPEMIRVLSRCDIAICPIRKGAAQSIINKHMDYAMAGLPVINTQECEEYRQLISDYECGINCECENSADVASAIKRLTEDECLRKKMGERSRKMGEELFDRAKSYNIIVDVIEKYDNNMESIKQ